MSSSEKNFLRILPKCHNNNQCVSDVSEGTYQTVCEKLINITHL